jgi:serine/threonine protein kinase
MCLLYICMPTSRCALLPSRQLGVMLYEFCEKRYPFGDDPQYADVAAEFVQPALLGDDGETEIPYLYDLVAGLLDWNPSDRLGVTDAGVSTLKQNPYWDGTDWELAAIGRLPSPLQALVRQRIAKRSRKEAEEAMLNPAKLAEIVTALTKDLNASQEVERKTGIRRSHTGIYDKEEEGEGSRSTRPMEPLVDDEVEGWEFTSEHAIAQEYIAMASQVVSSF